ncbi:MAG: hypothetical protein Q8R39_03490 [bacterium]|nr:hypothetical protein [bacterium]MDZ4284417.1 hypothetical protein [Patescibacteria group bacterium]
MFCPIGDLLSDGGSAIRENLQDDPLLARLILAQYDADNNFQLLVLTGIIRLAHIESS